jgi:hypothetical protein
METPAHAGASDAHNGDLDTPVWRLPAAPATSRIAPIDVLTVRAWARAYLWANCEMEMPDAVDVLQEYANKSGLVRELGQDVVQAIIATAFAPYQEGTCAS